MNKAIRVLIVDDEPSALRVLSAILTEAKYDVVEAKDVDSALKVLKTDPVDAIITDLRMPEKDGYQLFETVSKEDPDLPVIFLTAYGSVESAVNLMNDGAFYYFIKPPDYDQLKGVLARAVEQRMKKKELEKMKAQFFDENAWCRIIGKSTAIMRIMETIEEIKDSQSSVLITGETGTGKELIALNLHYRSKRHGKPFVAVNCAAMPKDLMESELFGYERGAFTGAVARRIGKFEEASGGSIFLDEIGEMDLYLQAKLLRVLQQRSIERIGSNKEIRVDFRLISSTNRNLSEEVRNGRFRSDLFYRLNVVHIDVPPLRERRDDIPLLVGQMLGEFCAREDKMCTLTGGVMEALTSYSWPGNVRQLKNVIERAVVISKGGNITRDNLPEEILGAKPGKVLEITGSTLKQMELQAIRNTLEMCKGNKSKAAKQLGISRKAFYKKLKELEEST